VTVGCLIDAVPGSRILGKNVSVGVGPRWIFGPRFVRHGHGVHDAIHWNWILGISVFALLLGGLVVLLMGRGLDVFSEHLERKWPVSLAVGFLAMILVPPAILLLVITIIGIPLALVLIRAVTLGLFIGFFAAVVRTARLFFGRSRCGVGPNARAMAFGVGLLVATWLASALLRRTVQPFALLGGLMQVVCVIFVWVSTLCGLGALIVSQFGSKLHQVTGRAAAPAPGAPLEMGVGSAFEDAPAPAPWTGGAVPYDGAAGAPPAAQPPTRISEKRILPGLLLCLFFGTLGAHRFYVGKIGTGIAQVLTLGGLGIWALVDLILIRVGVFTDQNGAKITLWT
jgi:TM2 domain-containing membrane protein YozV